MTDIDFKIKYNNEWKSFPNIVEYDVEMEDLDSDSYRNPVTGDLISNIIKPDWSKLSIKLENLTSDELATVFNYLSQLPIEVKAEHPKYTSKILQGDFRNSRKQWGRMKTSEKKYYIDFNLVQIKGVSGQ